MSFVLSCQSLTNSWKSEQRWLISCPPFPVLLPEFLPPPLAPPLIGRRRRKRTWCLLYESWHGLVCCGCKRTWMLHCSPLPWGKGGCKWGVDWGEGPLPRSPSPAFFLLGCFRVKLIVPPFGEWREKLAVGNSYEAAKWIHGCGDFLYVVKASWNVFPIFAPPHPDMIAKASLRLGRGICIFLSVSPTSSCI